MAIEERAECIAPQASGPRKIIHIDMDAFYASVEQRDNPELRGKPVAVGGSQARGVVAAASYEARKFGVHSAMPSVIAKRKCPDLIFVNPRFDAYKAVSLQIREVFAEYTPIIEPLSLDEAYLDVTENLKGIKSATLLEEEIRARILAETELTASAGVSYNKFLAKLASDHRKPDGLFVITPAMGPEFVETLPVRKFHGVGPATAKKMERLGIATGLDLRAPTLAFLQQHCSNTSGKRAPTITGPRAASTSGPSAPIGYGNRSAPRTRFSLISSPTKPRAMRSVRLSKRSGGIASAPVFVGAPSHSRSNSPTSSK
jgi:nucleotidyltransferase/DNA polymerase involved in DNA repair